MRNLVMVLALACPLAACGQFDSAQGVAANTLPALREAIVKVEAAYVQACPLPDDSDAGVGPILSAPESFCEPAANIVLQARDIYTQVNTAAKGAQ